MTMMMIIVVTMIKMMMMMIVVTLCQYEITMAVATKHFKLLAKVNPPHY